MSSKKLVLLSGTAIQFDQTRSIVLPEMHDDLAAGDVVVLENERSEFVGEAEIASAEVETFALLQQRHFTNNAHPELGSWSNAYTALQRLVPGFSQSDKVTVVVLKPFTVSSVGVTINRADVAEPRDGTEPTEEEAYAALNDFIVEEHE